VRLDLNYLRKKKPESSTSSLLGRHKNIAPRGRAQNKEKQTKKKSLGQKKRGPREGSCRVTTPCVVKGARGQKKEEGDKKKDQKRRKRVRKKTPNRNIQHVNNEHKDKKENAAPHEGRKDEGLEGQRQRDCRGGREVRGEHSRKQN